MEKGMKIPKKKRANISYFPFDQAQRWVDVAHHRIGQRLIRSFSCFHHCRLAFFYYRNTCLKHEFPKKRMMYQIFLVVFTTVVQHFLMTAIQVWNMNSWKKNDGSCLFDVFAAFHDCNTNMKHEARIQEQWIKSFWCFGRWVPQLFMELSHDEAWIWSITDPEVAWFWGSLVIDAWKGADFALREQIYLYRCQRKPNPWKPSCINSPRLIIGACI